MIGEPTEVTTVMQRYADGKITWLEARAFLLNYPYKVIVRPQTSPGSTGMARWYAGTWNEVEVGLCNGLIDDDEYCDLLDALEARDTAEKERQEYPAIPSADTV